MQLSRRHVLAALALVPVAGALGLGTAAFQWWNQSPDAQRVALSKDEYAFVQAVAEGWMPPGGTPALSGRDADLGAFLDHVLSTTDPTSRKLMKLLLHALDHSTWPTHAAAYRALSLEQRSEVLAGWLRHDSWMWRTGATALIALLSFGWTNHPDVVRVLRPMFPCGIGE